MSKRTVTFEFDSEEVKNHFMTWFTRLGEQTYWNDMREVKNKEEGNIGVVEFIYWSKDENGEDKFLGDNIVRTISGRLDKE